MTWPPVSSPVLTFASLPINRYHRLKPSIPFDPSPPSTPGTPLRTTTTRTTNGCFTPNPFGSEEDEVVSSASTVGLQSLRVVVALLRNLVPSIQIGSSRMVRSRNQHLVDPGPSTTSTGSKRRT